MTRDHTRLLCTYSTPAFRYGDRVRCTIRGEVEIVGLSAGPIPWPIGKRGRHKFLVLYDVLVDAVRRESQAAICHHWGVGTDTVWRWRRALGVGASTEGTQRLRGQVHADSLARAREVARPGLADPKRAVKISISKKGKSRPAGVGRATGKGHLGLKHSDRTRARMSASHKGKKKVGRPWTAEEDELVRTLTPREVAEKTGRAITAVWSRRKRLKVNPAGG